jgi:purine-binding chemotaxis protein CheW
MTDTATLEQALQLLNELRARLAMVENLVAPKPSVQGFTDQGELKVLLVQVKRMEAALPLQSIQEVVPYAWLTRIPEAPAWVAGLLDLGGQMICVLDVAARATGEAHTPRVEDFIVVCQLDQRAVGLCVNAVRDVVSFPASAVAPPPRDVPYAPYLLGSISHGASPILLLSAELLLHGSELSTRAELRK